jgi:hypothetical protein
VKISQQNQLISKRTKNILKKLDERGSSKNINRVSVKILSALKKGEVKVKDLGKLQAATHDEYTLLRGPGKYGERVLIRGTPNQVGIPEEYIQKEYVWSGHSHPDDTSPSQYDRNALSAFAQEYSVIVSACQSLESKYKKFDQIEDWSSWLP